MDVIMENADVKVAQLSIKQLSILLGAMVGVMTAGTAALGYVFASKADVKAIELKLADTGESKLTQWRISTVEVKQSNMEARLQKMDVNLTALLGRFRVEPAPEPVYKPLPEPPKPKE